jgi:2-desacetyl-2-hydroxyethyl bacteriochlorophyllide A dehydrogenase
MSSRARGVAIAGIDRTLTSLGYRDSELLAAHADVVDWGRARIQAASSRTGIVTGSRIVVTGRGRAGLRRFDRPLAGPDQVTVEVIASAISAGTERAQWLRLPNAQPDFPYAPGYSAVGAVVAAGSESGLTASRLVAVARLPHASLGTVPAAWATPVPDGVDPAEAALVYLAIIAGYGVRRAALRPGERLCVIGAGTIGALAQRLAIRSEPGRVTVVARTRSREPSALAGGAGAFMTADDDLDGIEAASVIEATGDPAALAAAVRAARPGGTVVLLGSPRGRTPAGALADAQRKGLRLAGAHISALATEARTADGDPFQQLALDFLEGLARADFGVADLVGEAVDPREAQLVYRRLARRELAAAHFDWRLLPERLRLERRSLVSVPRLPPRGPRLRPLPVRRPTPEPAMRFALLGCGDIGVHNARAISEARNAALSVCFDPAPGLAAQAAERFHATPTGDLGEALDPDRVDAAFICVPHDLHASLVEQAAGAGLQVVVEKPLAQDLDDARRAADAAERAGVALSVCFPFRYEPQIQLARALVADGALGAQRGASVAFHIDKPESYWLGGFSGRSQSDWRASRARAGGGVLIMNLTHYVDFIRYVAGAEPERVLAVARSAEGSEVEDSIALTIEFAGGGLGSIFGSASTPGAPPSGFELWGDLGTLRLEPDPAIYSERTLGTAPAATWVALPTEPEVDPRTRFVERFAEAVASGRPVDVSAADGLAVQALVDAAYRSAESGDPEAVELPRPARVG